jgi:hypothetical protein
MQLNTTTASLFQCSPQSDKRLARAHDKKVENHGLPFFIIAFPNLSLQLN